MRSVFVAPAGLYLLGLAICLIGGCQKDSDESVGELEQPQQEDAEVELEQPEPDIDAGCTAEAPAGPVAAAHTWALNAARSLPRRQSTKKQLRC